MVGTSQKTEPCLNQPLPVTGTNVVGKVSQRGDGTISVTIDAIKEKRVDEVVERRPLRDARVQTKLAVSK